MAKTSPPLPLSAPSLHSQARRGIAWIFSTTAATAAARVVLFAGLARMLHPADFGLYAATTSVLGIVEIVALMGVGPSLIQREQLTDRHISTALVLSICFGGVATAGMWLAAGPISAAMKIAELKEILRVLSPIFFIRSLSMVGNGLASRAMDFSLISRIEIITYVFGYGLFSVVLAACGFGAWSLILGYVIQQGLGSLLICLPYGQKFSLKLHAKEVKDLLSFSSGISLANIANYIAQQGDYYVVGRMLGVESLGLYNRAYNLMQVSVAAVINALDRVLFPALSKLQNDLPSLAKALRLNTTLVWMIYLPLSAVLIVCARDVVAVLLGGKWLAMTGAFRILTVGLLFRAGYKMAGTVLKVRGQAFSFALTQFVYAAAVVIGAAMGAAANGIQGTATGVLVALGINYLLLNFLGFRSVGQTLSGLYRELAAAVLLTVAVLAASLLAQQGASALGLNTILRLSCVGAAVSGVYFVSFRSLSRVLLSMETIEFMESTWQGLNGYRTKLGRRLRKWRPLRPQVAKV